MKGEVAGGIISVCILTPENREEKKKKRTKNLNPVEFNT